MNCYYHPTVEAVATCTYCGRAICQEDTVEVAGRFFCREDVAAGRAGAIAQGTASPGRPTNTLAIISLVLGILGFCGGIFFSIPAWITGTIAERQLAENPDQDGLQFAKAGRIIGMILTIIFGALLAIYLCLVVTGMASSLFNNGSY